MTRVVLNKKNGNVIILKLAAVSTTENAVTHRTTSTAPARTLGSRPVTDMLAVNDPSILNTTHSVLGGTTAM